MHGLLDAGGPVVGRPAPPEQVPLEQRRLVLRRAQRRLDPRHRAEHAGEVWPVAQVPPVGADARPQVAAAAGVDDAAGAVAHPVDARRDRQQGQGGGDGRRRGGEARAGQAGGESGRQVAPPSPVTKSAVRPPEIATVQPSALDQKPSDWKT